MKSDTNQLQYNLKSDTCPACPCPKSDSSAKLAWCCCVGYCTTQQMSVFELSQYKVLSVSCSTWLLATLSGEKVWGIRRRPRAWMTASSGFAWRLGPGLGSSIQAFMLVSGTGALELVLHHTPYPGGICQWWTWCVKYLDSVEYSAKKHIHFIQMSVAIN